MIEVPVWTLPLMTALIFAAGVLLGCLVTYWQIGLIQAHADAMKDYDDGYRDGCDAMQHLVERGIGHE